MAQSVFQSACSVLQDILIFLLRFEALLNKHSHTLQECYCPQLCVITAIFLVYQVAPAINNTGLLFFDHLVQICNRIFMFHTAYNFYLTTWLI